MVITSREPDHGQRPKVEGDLTPALEKVISDQIGSRSYDPAQSAISAAAEIDKLMENLRSARDYLKQEAERIHRETARLKSLSKSALASVHLVSGNLSKWRGDDKKAA